MLLLTYALWVSIVADGTGAAHATIAPPSYNGTFDTEALCNGAGDKAVAIIRALNHPDRTAIYECRPGK